MKITVVGAGLSGLIAARDLASRGHTVVVVDKGRGVGGRLATRRIGDAVFAVLCACGHNIRKILVHLRTLWVLLFHLIGAMIWPETPQREASAGG